MSRQESGHWYAADGTACHTMPTKPGAKNPTRPTTIRDARALGLYPSVTTILGVMAKPQLDRWKAQQITSAAHSLRPEPSESPEVYHTRIMDSAFRKVQQAADAGNQIHDAAEKAMQRLEYDEDAPVYLPELDARFPLKTFVRPIEQFMARHEIVTTGHELRLVNKRDGYAGTTDVAMRCALGFGILDYKTRKTKPGKPCYSYDGQAMQISSYHRAHYHSVPEKGSHAVGCNLFVSTTEPGRVEAVWYLAEQLEREWHAFSACLTLWRHLNDFDPRISK